MAAVVVDAGVAGAELVEEVWAVLVGAEEAPLAGPSQCLKVGLESELPIVYSCRQVAGPSERTSDRRAVRSRLTPWGWASGSQYQKHAGGHGRSQMPSW